MKILLLADLHGEEEVLDRLLTIHANYDIIVVAGDLEGEDYMRRLLEVSDKIYWIPGNMDPKELCGKSPEKCIHGKVVGLKDGLKLIGFGYSNLTPFGTPGELEEGDIYLEMKKLPIDSDTILVTHVPPYGILDEVTKGVNAGSRGLRKIVEEMKPRILLCGHIHHAEGKEKFGDTTVVQIPPGPTLQGIVLEIDGGQVGMKLESL